MDIFMSSCAGAETTIISCDGGGDAGIWAILSVAVNVLSVLVGVLALIGIVVFGIQYSASAGNEAKMTKAKRRLIEIFLGIITYVVMYALLQWLMPSEFLHNDDISVESLSVNLNKSSIYVGDSTSVVVKISPDNATNKTFTLSVGDSSIANASSSSVSCIKAGQTTVKATAFNGKTATANLTCNTKPTNNDYDTKTNTNTTTDDEDEDEDDYGSGSGGGSSNSSQSFVDGTCIFEELSGSRLSIAKRALSEAEVRSCKFSQDPTYKDIVTLFKKYGIEDGSNEAIAIISWVEGEEYWDFGDHYLGYLSACVIINNVVEKKYGQNPLNRIVGWAPNGYYSLANLQKRYKEGQTNQQTLKPLYLALKYLYKNIYYCAGKYKDSNGNLVAPKNPIYTGKNASGEKIYVR